MMSIKVTLAQNMEHPVVQGQTLTQLSQSRGHENVHDDMIMYVIMYDLHPVHRYDQHIIAMINNSLS